MKKIFALLIFLTSLTCYSQQSDKFNLGFENQEKGNVLSTGWFKWGEYALSTDSSAYSGKKAGKITSSEAGGAFGGIVYRIPAYYIGKTIKLEGFMKIKNVENGFVGLVLRVDANGSSLAFDNMHSQNVVGTKDWQKYSITLDYPDQADNIIVGGMLTGKGEVWFDDLVVTIDGENIQTIKLPRAVTDNEFDHGSDIAFEQLNAEQVENLELLGRVWGFLKYHHTAIAQGDYNWDYELFRILPKYMEAGITKEKTALLVDWIGKLGELEECPTCDDPVENVYISPDFRWIEEQPEDLKNALLAVYSSRAQDGNFFVKINANNGRPDFTNEKAYTTMGYPDDGFRLLTLFRYWNMINYFFPNKHLMDSDWDLALEKFIPVFLNAENELVYELAILEMIEYIQDSHAYLGGAADKMYAWKGFNFSPVKVRFIGDHLVVTEYYNPALKDKVGLQVGDIITEINGESIEQIIKNKSKYYPASNYPTKLRNISMDILNSNSREISISYLSEDSKEQTKTIELYPYDSLGVLQKARKKSFEMLNDSIGYVTLETIKEEDLSQIKMQFKNAKGIIIDLRSYPALNAANKLGAYFVSAPTPFVKFSIGMVENPGAFYLTNDILLQSQAESYTGKLVVLVDEITQSLAEYTAMAFRAGDNTTIVGSTTAGADGDATTILLPGGLQTRISGVGVYYPDGSETQRIGIVPDVEVKPTIEGIREGRDELMEKALEILLKD